MFFKLLSLNRYSWVIFARSKSLCDHICCGAVNVLELLFFSSFFFLQMSRFHGYRSLFSPDNGSSHRDNWYSTLPDCVWTAAKESISRTYMNVYGLLNCFRHTVRWALRLSKSHMVSQGQEMEAVRSYNSSGMSCSVYYTPLLWVKCLLKTSLIPLPRPVIFYLRANQWLRSNLDYNKLLLCIGFCFMDPGEFL